jgi:glutathione peroxidase
VQYHSLNALQVKYANFKVLGIPSNQFGYQEPGHTAEEILNSVRYVTPGSGFVPLFDLTEKVDVNGATEHPLYTFLKARCPSPRRDFEPKGLLMYDDFGAEDIRWNWEKFLIDHKGRPVFRYTSPVTPEEMTKDIEALLAN